MHILWVYFCYKNIFLSFQEIILKYISKYICIKISKYVKNILILTKFWLREIVRRSGNCDWMNAYYFLACWNTKLRKRIISENLCVEFKTQCVDHLLYMYMKENIPTAETT